MFPRRAKTFLVVVLLLAFPRVAASQSEVGPDVPPAFFTGPEGAPYKGEITWHGPTTNSRDYGRHGLDGPEDPRMRVYPLLEFSADGRAARASCCWRKLDYVCCSGNVPMPIRATAAQRQSVECPLDPWLGLMDPNPAIPIPQGATVWDLRKAMRDAEYVQWRPWDDVDFRLEWERWRDECADLVLVTPMIWSSVDDVQSRPSPRWTPIRSWRLAEIVVREDVGARHR